MKVRLVILLCCCFVFVISDVSAQNSTSPQEPGDKLFAQMLNAPQQLDRHLALLHYQLEHQQLKQASASLERIRLLWPEYTAIRLTETEVLIQLGNIAEARYLASLIDPAALTPRLKERLIRIKQEISEVSEQLDKRFFATLTLSAGLSRNPQSASRGNQAQFFYPPTGKTIYGQSDRFRKTEEFSDTALQWRYILPHPRGYARQFVFSGIFGKRNFSHLSQQRSAYAATSVAIENPEKHNLYRLSAFTSSKAGDTTLKSISAQAQYAFHVTEHVRLSPVLELAEHRYAAGQDNLKSGQYRRVSARLSPAYSSAIQLQPVLFAAIAQTDARAKWYDQHSISVGIEAQRTISALKLHTRLSHHITRFGAPARYPDTDIAVYSEQIHRRDVTHDAELYLEYSPNTVSDRKQSNWSVGIRLNGSHTTSSIANFNSKQAELMLVNTLYF